MYIETFENIGIYYIVTFTLYYFQPRYMLPQLDKQKKKVNNYPIL